MCYSSSASVVLTGLSAPAGADVLTASGDSFCRTRLRPSDVLSVYEIN